MYDEMKNETNCVGPRVGELNVVEPTCMMTWKMCSLRTHQYYFPSPRVGPNGWQFLKDGMAFLDFSSYISIKDADTFMRFKGLDGI